MEKRLMRSRRNAMLGGVCSGLGEYFDVDAHVIRLVFVVLAAAPGLGIPAYILLWVLLPATDAPASGTWGERLHDGVTDMAERVGQLGKEVTRRRSRSPVVVVGFSVALIVGGVALLLHNLGVRWIRWLFGPWAWSVLLIAAGIGLLWQWMNHRSD